MVEKKTQKTTKPEEKITKELEKRISKVVFKKKIIINPKSILKGVLVSILIFYLLGALGSFLTPSQEEIGLSQALEKIKNGETKEVIVIDNQVQLKLNDGKIVFAQKEPGTSFTEVLKNSEIDPAAIGLKINNQDFLKIVSNIAGTILPLGLMVLLFWFLMKQANKAQNSIFSFGKSRAKLFVRGDKRMTFKDVAGIKEAKEELQEVIDFLKNPEKYRKMGARTPKGVLLIGPSGVGKTLLARAVAGEANVPFFSMAGSEFMEMLVGVGASRVRDLFDTAKRAGKAIIFIDEIDAIGRVRGLGAMGGHDEREQTLNQILVEMDGFEPNETIIVLAATNRADLLDVALLRPGRFDRRIIIQFPDIKEREAILKLHAQGKPWEKNVNWKKVAKRIVGFSGADIENMLNEAAILAARKNKKTIGNLEVEDAALKVKLGPERKRLQTKKDREMTAYHEAGHAVVTYFLPNMDRVQRVSIVSRGLALGYTMVPPKRDRIHETKSHLLEMVVGLMGGRVAEELVFREMTSGASSDLSQATKIARVMVIEYGMSPLGPINLEPQVDTTDWGQSYIQPTEISPQTQAEVDKEIKNIINQSYKKATKILGKNREKLDRVASALVEKETLEQEEFEKIMKG